ncbi:tetraacyldisaccharide 4'-kinase [Lutibaculum baratangense]|uniref:Tetraacyldisaccharide 4'-kinase n=1 Tax=Lutibaculum baratangense AMV1 TaxID=631454 RepID=V4QZ01_9HYPH|nr:tetraacyldisaccharide 4'-kinase [Lutibaculum baratangense]ESR24957.1 Tetraacyldisaccharide 4'-kinase [Lutibaculum baratangense AMV1]
MRAPTFWFRSEGGWPSRLLAPASLVYGGVAGRRLARKPRWRAPVPVICIGNPTVGGSGKTPTCLRIASMLLAARRQPVFLTRGYGGSLKGPVLVEDKHSSAEVGDEALLLARRAPTIVSADRVAGAKLAVEHGEVIVMDDGFQNPALFKDLSLLVIDAETGIGNGRIIPAGPLRVPFKAQLARADGVIVVGTGTGAAAVEEAARKRGLPVLRATLEVPLEGRRRLAGQRVYAFAGIGRPTKFFASLEEAGADVAGVWAFADHHPYTVAEAEEILNQARKLDAHPVTTEKDAARLGGDQPEAVRRLHDQVLTLPVELEFSEESAPVVFGLVASAFGDLDAEPSGEPDAKRDGRRRKTQPDDASRSST